MGAHGRACWYGSGDSVDSGADAMTFEMRNADGMIEKVKRFEELMIKDDAPWLYTDQGDKARIWGPDGDEVATVWDNLGMDISAEARAKSITDLNNIASDLIAVAGKFQPGDSDMLRRIAKSIEKYDYDSYWLDCLRRMAEAASIMEEE